MSKILLVLLLFLSFSLALFAAIYKWVDEEGNVHYGDCPPAECEPEQIETTPGPSTEELQRSRERAEQLIQEQKRREEAKKLEIEQKTDRPKETDESKMKPPLSVEELDKRCEEAIEKKIAPLRKAAIEECVANKRLRLKSPREDCERLYKDYGAGGPGAHGRWRPRMFHNIPECIEADKARREGGDR